MSRVEHPWEALSAFLDRELPPAEREAVERHLEVCRECRAYLDDLRHLGQGVAESPVPVPPPGLAERIAARSARKAARPVLTVLRNRRLWRSAGPLTAAASLLVAVLLGYLAGRDYLKPAEAPLAQSRQERPEAVQKDQVPSWEPKKEDQAPARRREEIEPKVVGGIEGPARDNVPVPQPVEVAKRQVAPVMEKGATTAEQLSASGRDHSKAVELAPGIASPQPEVKRSAEQESDRLEDERRASNEVPVAAVPSAPASPAAADAVGSAQAVSPRPQATAKSTFFGARPAAPPDLAKEKGVCSETLSRGRAEWNIQRVEEAELSLQGLAKRMGGACQEVRVAEGKPDLHRWELRIPRARWNEALLELTHLGVTLQEAETEKSEANPRPCFSLEIQLHLPAVR